MGKTKTAFVGDEEKKEKKQGRPSKVHIAGLKGGQRIKTIESEPIVTEETAKLEEKETKKKLAPKTHGKKYLEAKMKVNQASLYPFKEAIKLMKLTSFSKFDGSAEVHLVVKKTGLSANVTLPHAGGRVKKVEIASEETINKLKEGKIDFDILVASPDMMPKLVAFARVLGPKGLMPNPKNGTLLANPKKYSGNSLSVKTEREAPLIHSVFGKVGQDAGELFDNLSAITEALGGNKQIVKGYIKATMGPSIKIKI